MVIEMQGDLLQMDTNIIAHQVNFYGAMGAGVAAAIANRLLDDAQYAVYSDACRKHGRRLLGEVQLLNVGPNRYVANIFSQDDHNVDPGMGVTSLAHMREALGRLERIAEINGFTVALPGYMGCGIAGGDWQQVSRLIHEVFDGSPVTLYIVYRGTVTV